MSTRSVGNQLAKLDKKELADIDQYTTNVCLTRTMQDVVRARDTATNARQYFVANLVFQAVFEKDMGLLDIIATRIDGTVPVSGERESFANLVGDAIDDVLDMQRAEQTVITPEDPVIIAIAKVIYHIAVEPSNNNPIKKKERQKAVEMVYARTAGRRNEPVRLAIEEKFVEPEWLSNINDDIMNSDNES